MPGGRRHVVVAATTVVLLVLVTPAMALAGGGGNCSACQVYHEPNGPSAGKQQPSTQPQQPIGSTKSGGKQTHVPKRFSRVLSQAGKDRKPLSQLLGDAGIGSLRNGSGDVGSPSILGAAFDLGVGPTVLLAILLATALGLAARGSVRSWLLRRRAP